MADKNYVLYDVTDLPRRKCKKCTLHLPSREYSSDKTNICRECTGRSENAHKEKIDTDPKFNEISDRI